MAMATTILRTMLLKSFGALLFIGSPDGCNPKRILQFYGLRTAVLAARSVSLPHPGHPIAVCLVLSHRCPGQCPELFRHVPCPFRARSARATT
jgi:hypothetical protein